jgi:serine/threonine protein kinase
MWPGVHTDEGSQANGQKRTAFVRALLIQTWIVDSKYHAARVQVRSATCWSYTQRREVHVVCKQPFYTPGCMHALRTELLAHRLLQHRGIHNHVLYAVGAVYRHDMHPAHARDLRGLTGLLSDLCMGQSLDKWIPNPGSLARFVSTDNRLPFRVRMELAEHVLRGLEHAHAAGLVHMDVKPENVFLRGPISAWQRAMRSRLDGEGLFAVVADFGFATACGAPITRFASTAYAAPELHLAKNHTLPTPAMPSMDIWAVGIMLLDLVAAPGERARDWSEAKNVAAIESLCLYSDMDLRIRGNCEQSYRQLMLSCLQYRPESRPTAGQLLKAVAAAKAAYLLGDPNQPTAPPHVLPPPAAPTPTLTYTVGTISTWRNVPIPSTQ